MINEIDLGALIINLKKETHDISPYLIYKNKADFLIDRPFEENRKWNSIEQTSYIESLYLGCFSGIIVRFKNNNHTIICDGLNRYNTIEKYCENKLALNPKGLKHLKFLGNQKIGEDNELTKEIFKKTTSIKIIDYSYKETENKKVLTPEEELEIVKYLHVIYNTSLRLELEEMQKAEFANDYVSNKIKENFENDEEFIKDLENLKLFNGRKKRNKIENIVMNCRLLIASTYSNINKFCNSKNTEERIEENYLFNIENENKDKIYNDFVLNITLIKEKLLKTQIWNNNLILNTKPFLDATYWLISVIRKNNLMDPNKFNFINYIEYFAKYEEEKQNFSPKKSHYKANIYKKYRAVANYFEQNYGISLEEYFKEPKNKNNTPIISNYQELKKKRFIFNLEEKKVQDILNEFTNSNYILRPYYQREEVMNIIASSRIIESLILGIDLPYILLYDKYENNLPVTEVVDGQQRLLSLIGFLGKKYKNESGDYEQSKKNLFSLKGLKILRKYNNYQYKSKGNDRKSLSEDIIKTILNANLYIIRTSEINSNNFSAIDHFIRLNKSICTIKENSYRMWSLTSDNKIISYEKSITQKYKENILSIKNANSLTLKFASIFYYQLEDKINLSNFRNSKVSQWLKEFDDIKYNNMYKAPHKIQEYREKYFEALDQTDEFFQKINLFLNSLNKNLRDLLNFNSLGKISLTSYYYIYLLLSNISKDNLIDNKEEIYKIINEFFQKIKDNNISNINSELEQTKNKISIYASNGYY